MITATAPGKVILVGEHAVVYGQPAIAVPVWEVVASATIHTAQPGLGCTIHTLDTGAIYHLSRAPLDDPLALVTRLALARLGLPEDPDWNVELASTIPIASGMGSGAALSAALVRAIFSQTGCEPDASTVSELVFESERLYHGTPSGIDNTVVAHGKPIWYVKGRVPEIFAPGCALQIAIADSGLPSPTKQTVADVRRRWQAATETFEGWFGEIGTVVRAARAAMEDGQTCYLGSLLDRNQEYLAKIGVSLPILDDLIDAAKSAGALGAKLSGGGGGGNVIALVEESTASAVEQALREAGAERVIVTRVGP